MIRIWRKYQLPTSDSCKETCETLVFANDFNESHDFWKISPLPSGRFQENMEIMETISKSPYFRRLSLQNIGNKTEPAKHWFLPFP